MDILNLFTTPPPGVQVSQLSLAGVFEDQAITFEL